VAKTSTLDSSHLQAAFGLARRGLGRVWPNPSVGCVIVRDGQVVGRGWTQPTGRPHAETEALARAGELARGATAYVSLEPCAHHGRTPPCADALVSAGVARIVSTIQDPDERVAGRGFQRMRDAGIAVETGHLREEARAINAGFFMRLEQGRPYVTLKLATSLDGRIATHRGESRWITGEAARNYAHWMRSTNDAVMVGSGTAIADDPELTCRLPGLSERSPVRIVVDSHLRLPLTSKLVATARSTSTWIVTRPDTDRARRRTFMDCGVELIDVEPGPAGRAGAEDILRVLGSRGLTRLMVEGGGRLAAVLVGAGVVDEIVCARAGRVIGGDGVAAVAAFGTDVLGEAPDFVRSTVSACGEDVVETWLRKA
jgi:diaminohydroxyphosphoribosylaminopyrimidine deaminase / 5-amino-6-(5-phosphoribosylamino)uracil reductase